MKCEMKLKANYTTNDAKDKKDAVTLCLNAFLAELLQWSDGKHLASEFFDIEIEEVE